MGALNVDHALLFPFDLLSMGEYLSVQYFVIQILFDENREEKNNRRLVKRRMVGLCDTNRRRLMCASLSRYEKWKRSARQCVTIAGVWVDEPTSGVGADLQMKLQGLRQATQPYRDGWSRIRR